MRSREGTEEESRLRETACQLLGGEEEGDKRLYAYLKANEPKAGVAARGLLRSALHQLRFFCLMTRRGAYNHEGLPAGSLLPPSLLSRSWR